MRAGQDADVRKREEREGEKKMWRIIERDVIREGGDGEGDEGEGWRSARIFRAAINSVLCNIYLGYIAWYLPGFNTGR